MPETNGAVLVLEGELDLSTIGTVRDEVAELLETAPSRVVFDVTKVTFMDSAVLALFAQTARKVETVVRNPSPIIRRVIAATALDSVLVLEP